MKEFLCSLPSHLRDILVNEKILRAIEVVSILFGSIFIGFITIAFLYMDHQAKERQNEILKNQLDIQIGMTEMLKEKTDTGIISTLLARVCTDNEMSRVVNDLRKITESLRRKYIFDIISKQCNIATTIGDSLQDADVEIEYNKMNTAFQREVNIGRQYYRSHLWQEAADTWNRAVIPPFLSKSMIDADALKEARLALGRGNLAKAADLFKDAFMIVGSND